MSLSGSPKDVSLDGRSFPVASDADFSRCLGGKENELVLNGDGKTARVKQKAKPWKNSGVEIGINDDRGDQEFLEKLIASGRLFNIGITYANDAVYSGKGTIVGEMLYSSDKGTATLDLQGPGELKKQG